MNAEGPLRACARGQTVRQAISSLLRASELDSLELSQALGIPEREVGDHLEHLRRSLPNLGERLVVVPSRCLGCGFVFETRERLGRPGRCPACGRTRIRRPRFSIGPS